MKLRSVFLIMIFVFFMVGTGWAIIYLLSSGHNSFNGQVEDYLVSAIDSNEERIGDVFFEIEGDILFLAESGKVRDILKKEIGKSEEMAKLDVEGKSSIIVRGVENYIRSHPNMTLDDLVASNEFRAIATQKIGGTGYTALMDPESTMVYTHIDPEVEGVLGISFSSGNEELENILDDAILRGSADGFYDWVDISGKRRRKYTEIGKIDTRTVDGKTLLLATTAYVDDYLIAQNVSEDLNNYFTEFNTIRNYHNILFLSRDNRVVYMAGFMDGFGSNLRDVVDGFGEVSSLVNGLKGKDVGFYGPFVGHAGDRYLQFAAASKVYDGEDFLGTLIIIDEMDLVNEILLEEEYIQFGEFDEDYLINEHGLLITPLRARTVDVMVQEVKTDSAEECLEHIVEAEKRGVNVEEYEASEKISGIESPFVEFLNYNGDLTYGLHRSIGRVNWCVLSEVNAENVLDEPMEKGFRKQIVFGLWLLLVMVLLAIVASLFIDKRYVLKRRKKIFRENFFTRLGLGYYLLFGIVFVVAYLYVVTLFFQGIRSAKLFDDIPDMLVFVVGFMIFAIGLKIRNMKARYFIIYGGLLICIRRLFDIPLQEYQVIVGYLLTPFLWVPVLTAEFMGFLLLLIGYRRLVNG